MDARNSFFNYISSNKPFSTNKSTYFTHFLPLYFLPPSPSENGRFGVYHRGQNRYHDST